MNKGMVWLGVGLLLSTAVHAKGAGEDSASAMSESVYTELATPYYFGVLGLYTRADEDRSFGDADIDYGSGVDLLFGKSSGGLGYEIHGWTQTFETGEPNRTDFYNYGLGVDLTYSFGDRTKLTPFALIGAGAVYNDVFPNDNDEDDFDWFANAGLGIVTGPLTDVGQLRLRAEARYVYDNFSEQFGDIRYSLGIEIPLYVNVGLRRRDSDGDGVYDDMDKCPGTPRGTRVDNQGCPLKEIVELKGVNFDFDKTELRPDAIPILNDAVVVLKRYPEMNVEVAGHTDNIADDDYNQRLSEGRATAVKDYFVEHGVSGGRLSAKGYGEKEPVADNSTAAGRQRNRRVELRILN